MKNLIHFKSVSDSGYDAAGTYAEATAKADLGKEVCPYCGKIGCIRHGYYPRKFKDVSDGKLIIRSFRMLRARCRACGRTHAVRCGIFAAYRQYSLALLAEICRHAKEAASSIKKICDSIPVCPRTVSRWKAAGFSDVSDDTADFSLKGPRRAETTDPAI